MRPQIDRPRITNLILTSIDGRLFPHRWTPPTSKEAVGYAVDFYWQALDKEFTADGWIAGRSTILDCNLKGGENPNPVKITPKKRDIHIGNRNGRQIAVAMDPHGKVFYRQDAIGNKHIVAVVGEHVSDDYLADLRNDGVSYIFAGEDGRDMQKAMTTLKQEFNANHLVLQGGAVMNAAFLNAGLLDEISLIVHPGVDGLTSIPSIYEYYGDSKDRPAGEQALKLHAANVLDHDVVWLRYHVVDSDRQIADLWAEKTPVTDIYDV